MRKIRPVIAVGVGPQSCRTVAKYVERAWAGHGPVQAILPVTIDYAAEGALFRRDDRGVQHITLESPLLGDEGWPAWLPPEVRELPPLQREQTRAWMRAAWFQQAEELQDFFLESVPRLSSFATAEALQAQGLGLAGNSEIDVYVIADLGDALGGGIVADVAHLASSVCHQLGFSPRTVGVLYLPSAISPAPVEEALAYAALKELEYYTGGHPYDGEPPNGSPGAHEAVLFDGGCYLLDSVNEAGYALQDEGQVVQAASEWLYAMTLLGLATAVDERRKRRYRRGTLRGRSRAFQSFGLSVRHVPRQVLLQWGAARLGHDALRGIMDANPDDDPSRRSHAFVERMGLGTDALEARIRHETGVQHVEDTLAPLYHAHLKEIEAAARQALQTIRAADLTGMDERVQEMSQQVQEEARKAVTDEVWMTLEETPLGGLSLAHRFLSSLHDQVSTMRAEVETQTRRHPVELSRSLATVSETFYALRQATMSVPPTPALALAVLALLILPLVYQVQLIAHVIRPLSEGWASLALGVLFVGALGVVSLAFYTRTRQTRQVSAQHVRQVRERFELESRPLIFRAIGAVYDVLLEGIGETQDGLDALAGGLRTLCEQLDEERQAQERALEASAAPGPFRSALDLQRAERFYQRAVPDPELLIWSLARATGTLSGWLARRTQENESWLPWLAEQIALFGRRHLEQHLAQVRVIDILGEEEPQAGVGRALARLFEEARPLWNIDPRALGRAKTQRLVLAGTGSDPGDWVADNGSAPGRPRKGLAGVCPDAIPFQTGDPHTLVVLVVHMGLPLFALRRIGEYRLHYAEMLWRSKLALHSTGAFTLIEDLVPRRRQARFAAPTLFAAGLALGIIGRDADGRYVAPRDRKRTIRLGARKERSVALLGLDEDACCEVQRQLGTLLASRGRKVLRRAVDGYLEAAPDLEDWEVRGILDFSRAHELAPAREEEEAINYTKELDKLGEG